MDNNTTTTQKDEAMKITDKEIREYLGHNGHECKIRITEDGDVYRYGHRDPMDRSSDYWAWMGKRNVRKETTMARKTKGRKIEGFASVVRLGTGCYGCMGFETPYVIFSLLLTGEEFWWSASDEHVLDLTKGSTIHLEAFAYGDTLRSVRVAEMIDNGDVIFYGMKPQHYTEGKAFSHQIAKR